MSVSSSLKHRWSGNNEFLRRFSSEANDKGKSEGTEVAVSEGKRNRLFPKRKGNKRLLWRNDEWDFPPALNEFFPSSLGNALMQATKNINNLFDTMSITPWSLNGRIKEKDDHYKLRYNMPGIAKEDVKITIDDGLLRIKGEHKEENEEKYDDNGDEYWSSSRYGYYNTSIVLPDDAKVDEIKAELKDGVLIVTIPRTEKPKKDVKQVIVH
ncbi:hypothetical protein TanjilG_21170 [Lupinus angustifolius]|uniref:SHSP domain-containing protein n=2 Tax=Lupinus angustifolius TaxID=3871 RepID=A0A1J7HGJ8_LUPAN|nr:hypothetical protein TanjilG_21170 [Lupinus angustifolius]